MGDTHGWGEYKSLIHNKHIEIGICFEHFCFYKLALMREYWRHKANQVKKKSQLKYNRKNRKIEIQSFLCFLFLLKCLCRCEMFIGAQLVGWRGGGGPH